MLIAFSRLLLGIVLLASGCGTEGETGHGASPPQDSTRTVSVGKGPDALLLTEGGKTAIVANVEDTTLSVLDLEKAEVVSSLEVGQSPRGLVHRGINNELVVSVWGARKLASVDEKSGRIKLTIPLVYQPTGLAIAAGGTRAYVAGSDNRLHGVNLESKQEFAAIGVGKDPDGVALTADGSSVWVTNTSGSASVVSLGTEWLETRIETGGKPEQIVAHPQRPLVFISNFTDNKVLIYRSDTLELIETLEGEQAQFKGPEEVRFSPHGDRLFLAAFDSNNLSCFDVDSLRACGQWTVGDGAIAVEITPDGRTMVTTNYRDDSVSVVSLPGALE